MGGRALLFCGQGERNGATVEPRSKLMKLPNPRRWLLLPIVALLLGPTSGPGLAAELAEIQARGRLIVAVKDNLRPLGFRDRTGKLQGLEIDIARRLAAELLGDADAVEFVPARNQERLQLLFDDTVDLVIAQLNATPTRGRVLAFSRAYYFDGTALVTADAAIATLEDFADRKIALLTGSQTATVLPSQLPASTTLVPVSSYQDALERLERGEVAAFAGDTSVLAGWVQEYPQYRLLLTDSFRRRLSVGLPKGAQHEALRRQVDAAIVRWQKSGWLAEARQRWGLP